MARWITYYPASGRLLRLYLNGTIFVEVQPQHRAAPGSAPVAPGARLPLRIAGASALRAQRVLPCVHLGPLPMDNMLSMVSFLMLSFHERFHVVLNGRRTTITLPQTLAHLLSIRYSGKYEHGYVQHWCQRQADKGMKGLRSKFSSWLTHFALLEIAGETTRKAYWKEHGKSFAIDPDNIVSSKQKKKRV